MTNKRHSLPITLLLLLLISQPLTAAPRVTVSLAPIHSLVSSLMQGVATPSLLFTDTREAVKTMDPVQQSQILTADLVIWVGAGLETSLAEMAHRFPTIENKLATLSNTLPLLRSKGFGEITSSRQEAFELAFWNDPRIAMMAIRQITPKLVRIDPDNTERYLDNEIRLLKRVKEAEQRISAMLSPIESVPQSIAADIDPYFAHRFIAASATHQTAVDSGFLKVSSHEPNSCHNAKRQTMAVKPGAELYFEALQAEARRIYNCANSAGNPASAQYPTTKPLEG